MIGSITVVISCSGASRSTGDEQSGGWALERHLAPLLQESKYAIKKLIRALHKKFHKVINSPTL